MGRCFRLRSTVPLRRSESASCTAALKEPLRKPCNSRYSHGKYSYRLEAAAEEALVGVGVRVRGGVEVRARARLRVKVEW